MTRDQLLEALLVERYAPRPVVEEQPRIDCDDSELTTARRRRRLAHARGHEDDYRTEAS